MFCDDMLSLRKKRITFESKMKSLKTFKRIFAYTPCIKKLFYLAINKYQNCT